jgi:hypothetical protein
VSGCRSFHSRVLALPSSTVVPLERPQPGCAELPFQPAPQQLERDPRGVDVSVPEGCLASTVGTAQDVPVALECDLLAHELGRATGRRAVERGSNAEHSVLASCRVIPPRAPWSLPARTCLRPLPTLHQSVPEAVQSRIFEALLQNGVSTSSPRLVHRLLARDSSRADSICVVRAAVSMACVGLSARSLEYSRSPCILQNRRILWRFSGGRNGRNPIR